MYFCPVGSRTGQGHTKNFRLMTFFEHVDRIKRLDSLIRHKATGSPEELADRMDVSRATIFRHLDDLRSVGAPIAYEKDRQTYYYDEPFDLKL